jgi:hypothetical protein
MFDAHLAILKVI